MFVAGLTASIAFVVGLALGILLGLFFGTYRRKLELKALYERLRKLEAVPPHGATSRKPAQHVEFGSMAAEGAILNEALSHMWPHLSEIAKGLLFQTVEPKLQERVPRAISGIGFSRTACHFGQRPIQIRKLVAASDQYGSWQNLKFTTELVLDGDCNIELVVPKVGQHLLGDWALPGTSVGVSYLKFRGTLVIELVRLLPRVPLISGIRVYFINPPILDLTVIGGLSGILNASIMKQHILDIVSHSLCRKLVLPRRMVHRFTKDLDIFKLKSPRPEGVLRVEVVDLDVGALYEAVGANVASRVNLFIRMIFGDRDWQTVVRVGGENRVVFEPESVSDFTVHNLRAQQLCIEVYHEERTRLRGTVRGKLLAQSWVPVSELTTQADAWWPLVHAAEPAAKLKVRFSVHSPRAGHDGSRRTRVEHKAGSKGQCRLRTEWRPYGKELYHLPLVGQPLRAGWRISRVLEPNITCRLLVGVHSAWNLPMAGVEYFCGVSCPSAVPFTLDGGRKSSKETQRVLGALEVMADGHVLAAADATVQAVWETPVFFHLQDPWQASVCLSVHHCGSMPGHASPSHRHSARHVGTVTYNLARLLARESLEEAIDVQLSRPEQQAPGHDACGTADEPPAALPQLRGLLKLWTLGPPLAHI